MNVVFLSPAYPAEMQEYTRGLAEVGANVFGVGDTPREQLAPAVKRYLADYLHVPRVMDEGDLIPRVHAWMRGLTVDRVLANWEPLVIAAARLRERLGVPGMSVDTVRGFRDKQLMKERVQAAGLRVPRSVRVRDVAGAHAAAEHVGYPLIVKPIAGAGSADTYAVRHRSELDRALARMQHVDEASIEELIEGEELTYDTLAIGGRPAYENTLLYLPKPLVGRSEEWISPIMITTRDMAQPALRPGIELGRNALQALGMGEGFTHMEWFRQSDGTAVFGEIACRPGGGHMVDLMNYTSDIDLFREWARVACWGHFEAIAPRRYNAAIVFKRAVGQGRITRIVGLREFVHRHRDHVVDVRLAAPGTPRRDWRQTLLSDGYLIIRHPRWDTANAIAAEAAAGITLYAS